MEVLIVSREESFSPEPEMEANYRLAAELVFGGPRA